MIRKLAMITMIAISSFAMGGASVVESTIIVKGEVNPLQEFVGTLKFKNNSNLAAQDSGVIQKIYFEVGDSVKKGAKLIQIDADLLNAQIDAARANLTIAKEQEVNSNKDYQRYKKLLESKAITQKEYEDALLESNSSSSSVKALSATLKELVIKRDRKSIKAPFDGVVVKKNVNLAEWVNAGSLVATIVNTENAEFTFNVPLNFIKGLKKGDVYDILLGTNIIKATMLGTIPNGDSMTRTFPVMFKAEIKNIFVFDGQEAKVKLSKNGKREALILPRDAVIKRFGQNVVFTINDKNLAIMIPVQIIGFVGTTVAIKGANLVAGMTIVSKGNERIFPNSPVKVINTPKK